MLKFLKKAPDIADEKDQAKSLYEKITSAKTESHEIRKAKLGLGMLCQAHLDSTFIAGAEQTAMHLEAVSVAIVNGEEKPEPPVCQEFIRIKRGEKFVWVYMPTEFAEQAFALGSHYQQTKISAQQAIDGMQALADQLCYYELKLDPPFVALQFLRDEMAAGEESEGEEVE